MTQLVGIDTGGTFTDFIVFNNGAFATHKILSTPQAPQQAILQGLQAFTELNLKDGETQLVHGTTVATNTLLQGKGARTAFVTNRGFKDLLIIGRQTRDKLYSLCPQRVNNIIPAELCFEIDSRVSASGETLRQVSNAALRELTEQLAQHDIEAVAISLLFAFLNEHDEVELAKTLQSKYFVSRSSELFAEQREYERGVVTWLNSYLGPATQHYLQDLQRALVSTHVHVIQSDATTLPVSVASQQAVKLLLSGPAGGVVAAEVIGKQCQETRLLTLDMGGTSTDVALINEKAQLTTQGRIVGLPLALPMLDIHTIGAGGGSIVRVDAAGGLHVGPESAGASPGPACYARGGALATITDANVVLGRLPAALPWSAGLHLDKKLAQSSVQTIAEQLHCGVVEAAQGIIELANAHMVQALRVISIQRGYDPSDFCLFPFGGAGGLHMCELAQQLSMRRILVPMHAGILSAFGMLHAPIGQLATRSICRPWQQLEMANLRQLFAQLEQKAQAQLTAVGIRANQLLPWLDFRYQGQAHAISLPWSASEQIVHEFARAHQQRYGFQLQHPIEVVTARVWAVQDVHAPQLQKIATRKPAQAVRQVEVAAYQELVPVFHRKQLAAGQNLSGPSILLDDFGTLFIAHDWQGTVDEYGHLHLRC